MYKFYYVYEHIRNDNNTVFYVGLSSWTKIAKYKRSKDIDLRNKLWKSVYNECGKDISINIVFVSFKEEEASKKEEELVMKYGRIIGRERGQLCNIEKGGICGKRDDRPIAQYDKTGRLIKIWDSGMEAGRKLNVHYSSIFYSIKYKGYCKDSIWKLYDRYEEINECINPYIKEKEKPIYQYDLYGKFIKEYTSRKQVLYENKISETGLSACLTNYIKSSIGFIWSYENNLIVKKKIILQYNLNGEYIKMWDSVPKIAKNINVCEKIFYKLFKTTNLICGYYWIKSTSDIPIENKINI